MYFPSENTSRMGMKLTLDHLVLIRFICAACILLTWLFSIGKSSYSFFGRFVVYNFILGHPYLFENCSMVDVLQKSIFGVV